VFDVAVRLEKMAWTIGAAAALALVLTAPAAAETSPAQNFSAVYAIKGRGVTAGEFSFKASLAPARYSASAERRSTGVVRMAVGPSQDYAYRAEGLLAAEGPAPVAYQHRGGKRDRVVRVAFEPEDVVTTAEPPMGMGDPPATPAQRRGAIDQVTMLVSLLRPPPGAGDPCGRTLPVLIDGRSRADFVVGRAEKLKLATPAFRGQGLRCSVAFKPIAGFSDPQEPATLTFLFAPLRDGLFAPVRIEMPNDDLGVVVLEARSFSLT
jgi:hypothetical protein